MTNQTVYQMTINEDGEEYPYGSDWHAEGVYGGSPTLLCTGEFFDGHGSGHSEGYAKCKSKTVKRGGITCESCLSSIRAIKAIRL